MTHAGHAHNTTDSNVIRRISERETVLMVEMAQALSASDFAVSVISGGSTITSKDAISVAGLNEIRPGTYIFNDLRTEELHRCTQGEIAATVVATVVSRPSADRLVLDAGSKTLTPTYNERYGYGLVRHHPDIKIVFLSEEHGVCTVSPNNTLKVGDRVEILPIHICVIMNMTRSTFLRTGDEITDEISVEAHLASR